jgi:hypothetical protein
MRAGRMIHLEAAYRLGSLCSVRLEPSGSCRTGPRTIFVPIEPRGDDAEKSKEHFVVSNNSSNGGIQNRLARGARLADNSTMTLKMKNLTGVDFRGALSSVEEHFPHTEGVAGSSPAARTIL